jgi:DNA-binding NarL/FixJ family response regulator
MEKRRLLLADDHTLMLEGLRKLMAQDFQLVGTVTDGRASVAAFDRLRPDLLLIDIGLPLMNGFETARQFN